MQVGVVAGSLVVTMTPQPPQHKQLPTTPVNLRPHNPTPPPDLRVNPADELHCHKAYSNCMDDPDPLPSTVTKAEPTTHTKTLTACSSAIQSDYERPKMRTEVLCQDVLTEFRTTTSVHGRGPSRSHGKTYCLSAESS